MAKNKAQKAAAIASYKQKIEASKALIFIRPNGITANESVVLKKTLHAVEANYHVIKNSLFSIALKEAGLPEIADLSSGANAVVYCGEDFVGAAKLLKEQLAKLEDRISIGLGILDGAALTHEQVKELADMPSFEVIIAQIAGVINQSLAGTINVVQESMRGTVSVLDQAFKA